jgi:hypothetical protein
MKTLTHRQFVRMENWSMQEAFEVGTLEGYAAENKEDIAKALERAIRNGHDLAWTINCGTVITNTRGYYEREEAKKANAVVLCEGEAVQIEGRQYKVKVMGKQYADPIHFIPA